MLVSGEGSFTIGSNIVVRATELPNALGSEDAEEALRSFAGDVLPLGELEEGRGLLEVMGGEEEGEDFFSLFCCFEMTFSASDQFVGGSSPIFSNSIPTGDSTVLGIVNRKGEEEDEGDVDWGVSGVGGTANLTDFSSAPRATTVEGLPIREVRLFGAGATEETRRKSGFKAASPRRAGVANRSNRELSNDSR